MHLWSIIAAAAVLVAVASAQVQGWTPEVLVLPIPGVPLAVGTIGEHVTTNPDGTSTTEIGKTKVYRDAAGRMRIETEIPDPVDGPVPMIQLADPVAGFIAILEPSAKIAHRLKIPKTGSPSGLVLSIGGNGLNAVPGKKTQKTEALGKQTIESIDFEGSRTTITSDDQPSLVAVDERWMSKEVGLIGLLKYSGPDGEITSRIQNTDRTAPDPALFVIPADYSIRELESPGPAQ